MSHIKTWVDHETVEITQEVTSVERVTISDKENNIRVLKEKIAELEADVANKKEALAREEKEVGEILALPNRPVEVKPEVIIDPLFQPEPVV